MTARDIRVRPGPKTVGKPRVVEVRRGGASFDRLAEIYNRAWVDEGSLGRQGFTQEEIETARKLAIGGGLLRKQTDIFPNGQLVALQKVQGNRKKPKKTPVGLLSTLVMPWEGIEAMPSTYDGLTSNRTFSSHRIPSHRNGRLAMFCVSIAVLPEYRRLDIAGRTLRKGLRLGRQNGWMVMPFSAPRGFGAFRRRNPGVPIEEYLGWTRPVPEVESQLQVWRRLIRLQWSNPLTAATYSMWLRPLAREVHELYAKMEEGPEAYAQFQKREGVTFRLQYGRLPTVVDFLRLTGRRHIDPVLDMHFQYGADFLYGERGRILGVLEGSRPQDVQAGGYNIVLTYDPVPGHSKH